MVYSRTTVPRPVNTGDSHSCDHPTAVPDRPSRPKGGANVGARSGGTLFYRRVMFVSLANVFCCTRFPLGCRACHASFCTFVEGNEH